MPAHDHRRRHARNTTFSAATAAIIALVLAACTTTATTDSALGTPAAATPGASTAAVTLTGAGSTPADVCTADAVMSRAVMRLRMVVICEKIEPAPRVPGEMAFGALAWRFIVSIGSTWKFRPARFPYDAAGRTGRRRQRQCCASVTLLGRNRPRTSSPCPPPMTSRSSGSAAPGVFQPELRLA